MLSKLVLAPRLGRAFAQRSSTPATALFLRQRPALTTVSPWVRTLAKGRGSAGAVSNSDDKQTPGEPQPPSEGSERPQGSSSKATPQAGASSQPSPSEAPKDEQSIPFDKLPDLTQGIPSTLEAEIEAQSSGKLGSALQTVAHERDRQRKERDDDPFMTTSERNRRWWSRFFMGVTGAISLAAIAYLSRDWDSEAEAARYPEIPDAWNSASWYQRVKARFGKSLSYYQDPAFDKLLPDPDPTFERPYTLCISLDDMLVHSEWTREHGWRLAKRPGFDYFIRYLSQYYELVLFTTVPFAIAEPMLRKLDPFHFIIWPLFREATKFEDGEVVKDLSYLNRDLSKVIIMDTKTEHVRKQPENAIIMKPWKGDPKDSDLVGMIPFLEYICTMQYSDVRKVLKSFEGKHIPTEFARREAIARREFNKQLEEQHAKHRRPSWFGTIGNALGLKPGNMSMTVSADGEQNPSEAFAQGKMLQDIARERGQRNYQLLEQQITEHGEKWLKEEQAAMEKAQQEAMNSMVGGFSSWFTSKVSSDNSGSGNSKPSKS